MNKLNVAVVGVGNMGQFHARIYSQIKNVNLVAVCDVNSKRAQEIGAKYSVPFFSEYKDLTGRLLGKKLDIVSIAVPTKYHHEVACYFLKKNINVLLEKPIANNLLDAKEIIRAANSSRGKLMIGHVERFNPAFMKLKEIVSQGELGKIISIVARRVGVFPPNVKDSNVFLDLAVHDVDAINYLLGQIPKRIYKRKGKFHTQSQEDVGEMFLLYEDAAAFIQVNWITPVKIRTLSVTGTKGYAELDYISQDLVLHKAKIKKRISTFSEFLKFSSPNLNIIKINKEEPLKIEINSFVDSVLSNRKISFSPEDAFDSLKICLSK
jgi:UDP-N-acetylglucosamine 3-dehydrogenase